MSEIRTWLDNALLQSAAESYLHGIDLDLADEVQTQLRAGANDFSKNNEALLDPNKAVKTRFTTEQAKWFTDTYTIVDHLANTDSGFSATLFQKKGKNEYTLSFRSTESRFGEFDHARDSNLPDQGGDWARDGSPGADGEIAFNGFSFGQLADMEDYIKHLAAGETSTDGGESWQDGGVRLDGYETWVSGGGKITATGYSLGAHMSTAATMMHPELIAHTYNYNAAGLSRVRDLQQINILGVAA